MNLPEGRQGAARPPRSLSRRENVSGTGRAASMAF